MRSSMKLCGRTLEGRTATLGSLICVQPKSVSLIVKYLTRREELLFRDRDNLGKEYRYEICFVPPREERHPRAIISSPESQERWPLCTYPGSLRNRGFVASATLLYQPSLSIGFSKEEWVRIENWLNHWLHRP